MASPWQTRGRLALVLVTLALVLAAVAMLLERAPEPAREGAAARAVRVSRRAPTPEAADEAPACALIGAACHAGDVWLMDACGGARERLEVCDGGCEGGSCREADEAPAPVAADACIGLSELGVCEGDVAVGCAGGQPFRVDCAAAGKRCVMTDEGAVCRAPSADDCAAAAAPSCVDDVLRYCHHGRWASLDCRGQGARCDADSGRCVQVVAAAEGECGACGCPSGPSGDEVCDGRDNDGDGEVDEDVTCAPIPLLFFVVGDRPGASRDALEAAVARLDRAFADRGAGDGPGLGLTFSILDVVAVDVPAWVDPDEAAWAQMVLSERFHPARDGFYVPIALVGSIVTGDVPKAGVATIPNGTCGGQRRGAANQIGVGLVMVADRRSPTTLAHEIGHFLGLCHTHADDADVALRVVVDADGESVDCGEPCAATGDGVCDTPADPGVEACAVDRACEVSCGGDARPDPRNIMSYYTWCRRQFTRQQLAIVRTSLWLRRGWHRCIFGVADEACVCTPGLRECPEAMSCWPYSSGDACWLDGPLPPGAGPCTQHVECSLGALCVARPDASTCVRPCLLSQPGCTCVDVGVEHRMCKEDLGLRGD